MKRFAHSRAGGFTILELLVAMSITIVLLFLINRLFFDTVHAVGQGAALGRIFSASRIMGDQIDQDAQYMTGPSEGGFLVIINREIANVTVQIGEREVSRTVRSDQLVFIRGAEGVEPLAPGGANSFNNGARGSYARVWYGHVLRTNPDGTSAVGALLGNDPNNRLGNEWILGRQALLLTGGANGSSIYVNGAAYNSIVNGLAGISPTQRLYMGLSDQSRMALYALTGPRGTLTLASSTDYKGTAYDYTFASSDSGVFGRQRLRVNPRPDGTTFESWRIGQMHPCLMENVSDFIVEFAVDANNSGELDVHGGTGNIVWRSMEDPPPWSGYGAGFKNPNHVLSNAQLPLPDKETRFTFQHDYPDNWPYLIRVRYRLHDARGAVREFVGAGAIGGREPGKWFEHIFRVNRQ